ncbi:NAD(+) synthase [Ornithinimicrobium sp. CNJ-824]|uniref:NAD(+) synthase n=1 Tax=Ornithinimicrobium sp. CNJ-824 TaxID=1904966 RepID=UPI00096A5570|nr:NAD(+) synthase [Ornithinimicrobium sp. CNJ-824]
MAHTPQFGHHVLDIDCETEVARIVTTLRDYLTDVRRKGFVVALSGGIDSSVTAALCVRAVGPERVFGLHMPERASAPETIRLSRAVSDTFAFDSEVEEIAGTLEAIGCYRRYDDAVRRVVPGYGAGWRSKIVLPSVTEDDTLRLYSIVVEDPDGQRSRHRLSVDAYLGVVAATNFKQRVRKVLEYHHADRLNYATTGTPNLLEYDQGFFVKLGDGAADVKPIAHLYKTQVYALGEHLGVPAEILDRPSTTDTYSLAQSQEEFYFSLPHHLMDLALYARDHDVPPAELAQALDLDVPAVERVLRDIDQKRRSTRYLHQPPVLVEEIGPGDG